MRSGPAACLCFRTPKPRYRHARFSLLVNNTDFPVPSSTETITSSTGKYILCQTERKNFGSTRATLTLYKVPRKVRWTAQDTRYRARCSVPRNVEGTVQGITYRKEVHESIARVPWCFQHQQLASSMVCFPTVLHINSNNTKQSTVRFPTVQGIAMIA